MKVVVIDEFGGPEVLHVSGRVLPLAPERR